MKNRFIAALFAWMFGWMGLNLLYTNNTKMFIFECIMAVLFFWTAIIPALIYVTNIIYAICYLWCNTDEEFNLKYVSKNE